MRHELAIEEDEMRALTAQMKPVMEAASKAGLRGVMIMARKCPGCGHHHDFALFTDIGNDGDDIIIRLLEGFAEQGRSGQLSECGLRLHS